MASRTRTPLFTGHRRGFGERLIDFAGTLLDVDRTTLFQIAVVIGVLVGAMLIGTTAANDPRQIMLGFALVLVGLLSLLIVTRPFVGVILIVVALPIDTLIPDIPFLTSGYSVIGYFTLGAYLVRSKFQLNLRTGMRPQYFCAVLFLLWIIITNPAAAFGVASHFDTRWVFTYIQLIVLMWLISENLTPARIRLLMMLYVMTASFSSGLAIRDYNFARVSYAQREAGLANGINELGMYAAVGCIFALHMINDARIPRLFRLVSPVLVAIQALGVIATVSRGGFAMLASGLILSMLFLNVGIPLQSVKQHAQRFALRMMMMGIIIVGGILFVPSAYWNILSNTVDQIVSGTEVGKNRYAEGRGAVIARFFLWERALETFSQYPITGIGVGQGRTYIDYAETYTGIYDVRRLENAVAHNMFLSVLSETGLVGFTFYMGWLGFSSLYFVRAMLQRESAEHAILAKTWFIAQVMICIMGVTSSFHYSKLLWATSGVSLALFPVLCPAAQEASTQSTQPTLPLGQQLHEPPQPPPALPRRM